MHSRQPEEPLCRSKVQLKSGFNATLNPGRDIWPVVNINHYFQVFPWYHPDTLITDCTKAGASFLPFRLWEQVALSKVLCIKPLVWYATALNMFNLAAHPSVWGAPVFAQIWDKAPGFIQTKVYRGKIRAVCDFNSPAQCLERGLSVRCCLKKMDIF